MMRKLFLLISFCFLGLNTSTYAEKIVDYYDISIAGITIGELKASKESIGVRDNYEIHSVVKLWFFGSLNIEFLLRSTYENGQFISSTVDSSTNRGDFLSVINWQDDSYRIDANSYKFSNQTSVLNPIFFSSALLFFKEPAEGVELLSENYGLTCIVEELKEGVYEVDINKNENKYHYIDGKLDKVQMEFPIKDYVIKRRE